MTHLELVAEIGSSLMEIVKMYRKGMITFAELENILGCEKAGTVQLFYHTGSQRAKDKNFLD